MATIGNLKKSRSANRNVVKGYVTKAKAFTAGPHDENTRVEIEAVLEAVEIKWKLIVELDEKILELLEEDAIEADVDEGATFELQLRRDLAVIKEYLRGKIKAKSDVKSDIPSATGKASVKLPKIFIKKFYGDPISWQQFYETFEATVHKNDSLSGIEKFSYLKGYLGGAAEKSIEGFKLTNDNYQAALDLLKERYANPQLTIASHMNKILQVEKVSSSKNVKELRQLYDKIECHVRSLKTVGIDSEHYGPLLIPIILERMPSDIKLEISRKLGTSNWQIEMFMGILKDEITARESCDFLMGNSREVKWEKDSRHLSTEALFTSGSRCTCAFCGENHYHDKCTVVTDVKQRKEIVWRKRLCYR